MSLTTRHAGQGIERANKIFVNTTHSSDGRNLEGFWMDYDPSTNEGRYALFLLQETFNVSPGVEHYSVFNAEGVRDKNFRTEHYPKRI